ncbi:MAG: type II secretory pathway component GspD/PulD (secretin) [Pseudohongiellaceae bacterium]|jgi:type II secretory pathway component GspD/PulD (secretin)
MTQLSRFLVLAACFSGVGCVSEELKQPRSNWSLSTDSPVIAVSPTPEGRASLDTHELLALTQAEDDESDQLSFFDPATPDDLEPDYLAEQAPTDFHRLGRQVIHGLDGSWTKMYSVRAGRGTAIVDLMRAYVADFPVEAHTPNFSDRPATEIIKWSLQQNFYRDEVSTKFGSRKDVMLPDIADVIHVTAPPPTLLFIDELLQKVLGDQPQIEIEITVVEVNLSDKIDWDAKLKVAELENRNSPFDPSTNPAAGGFGSGIPFLDGNVADGSGAGFSSFPDGPISLPGFLLSLQGVHDSFSVKGIISVLQTIGAAELLSTPKITVLNGHHAKLTTGDKLPVFTANGSINNPTVTTVFEQTGVTIELIPFIVAEDLIRIDLAIDVSSQTGSTPFVVNGVDVSSPVISQRTTDTTLHVYSGQSFTIGGLRQKGHIETLTKVPFLGDIPLIGWFFKSRLSEEQTTEILFLVEPTIKVPSRALIDPLRR